MKILISIFSLVFVGCATSPVLFEEAKNVPADRALLYQEDFEGSATIQVVRDAGFMGSGCFNGFYIDDALAARVGPGEFATLKVKPGEYELIAATDKLGGFPCAYVRYRTFLRPILIHAGEVRKFRISLSASGVLYLLKY